MNEQQIEKMAKNYRNGSEEENCRKCEYHEEHKINGLQCLKFMLKTKMNKKCDGYCNQIKPVTRVKTEDQTNTLF